MSKTSPILCNGPWWTAACGKLQATFSRFSCSQGSWCDWGSANPFSHEALSLWPLLCWLTACWRSLWHLSRGRSILSVVLWTPRGRPRGLDLCGAGGSRSAVVESATACYPAQGSDAASLGTSSSPGSLSVGSVSKYLTYSLFLQSFQRLFIMLWQIPHKLEWNLVSLIEPEQYRTVRKSYIESHMVDKL